MDYIVLDMEWNQPWPGSPSAKKALPVQIRGEIIQIGAVRILEDQTVADEFKILIKPKYYHRLNKRVSKLTGIKDAQLRQDGIPFPQAMEQFRQWCGPDVTFLTWGFDDIAILRENLSLFGLEHQWTDRWFNVQMIFNAQTDGSNAQKALATAMGIFGIVPSRPAHDALGDAYHTALICAMLDLPRGIQEYEEALKSHENGFHGAEIPGCLTRKVYYGLKNKEQALELLGTEENLCPTCGIQMTPMRWFAQPGRRYMTMTHCPEHGEFLLRVRLSPEADGTLRASRLIYRGDSEAARAYALRAERAAPARQHRRRKRRRTVSANPEKGSAEQ